MRLLGKLSGLRSMEMREARESPCIYSVSRMDDSAGIREERFGIILWRSVFRSEVIKRNIRTFPAN